MNATKLLKSFKYALEGITLAAKEKNFRIHLIAMITVIGAGIFTGLSKTEWIIIVLVIAGMLSLEMINSAIENVVDLVTLDYKPLAKAAKDLAAGAVLIYAIASVIIGCIIFLPKWF